MNLLKRTTTLGIISSTIFLSPLASQALTVEEVPNPQTTNNEWVTDMVDILSDDAETKLNQLISNLEQTNGAEIAVVTVPETAPADSPKTFATQLFNHWGIGKAESNNGILFLISTGDNRVEIETGYGIEAILSDAQVGNIIDTKVTPQYKRGNFDSGTLDGTRALISSLDDSMLEKNISVKEGNWYTLAIWSSIVIGIGISILSKASKARFNYSKTGFNSSKNKFRKVLINPTQAITHLYCEDLRDVCCSKCKQTMKKVDNITLTKVQQVAKKLGSVSYKGYKCSSCSNSLQPYSLLAYVSQSPRYQKCPECQDFTVTRTVDTLKKPTLTSKGKRIDIDICHCCDYIQEKVEILPMLRGTKSSKARRPKSSGGSSGGGAGFGSGGYYGGGCSGSSGGGFSGGSGGGGAGGSW